MLGKVQLGKYQQTLIPISGTHKYKVYVILPLWEGLENVT